MTRALVLSLWLCADAAWAGESATFALVIGVNQSIDLDLPPLRYADDDAARYVELFRLLGAHTWLLTSVDENTRRLHPQATAEAANATQKSLEHAVTEIAAALKQAHERGIATALYVIYAGHGNVRDGSGYLLLEDTRLPVAALRDQIFAKLRATRTHFIVDACYSSFLAIGRGPGGARRPAEGFSDAAGLSSDGRLGMLLSTASARESHEWEGFQAGVFSHEVLSGLFGAADADGDSQVSYREIAAFVQRANAAIPNEKYRPDIHARAPRGGDGLIDLRDGLKRRLEVDGTQGAHWLLEDSRGVRLADFHNAPRQAVRLLRPASGGGLYLRRVDDDTEFELPATPEVVKLAGLQSRPARVGSRGAAHDAFSLTFAMPYDRTVVEAYSPAVELVATRPVDIRRPLAIGLVGVGVAALAAGGAITGLGVHERSASNRLSSQVEVAALNRRLAIQDPIAVTLYAVGGLAVATGATLWLLTLGNAAPPVAFTVTPTKEGAQAMLEGRF